LHSAQKPNPSSKKRTRHKACLCARVKRIKVYNTSLPLPFCPTSSPPPSVSFIELRIRQGNNF
jgi:hypothetical protein